MSRAQDHVAVSCPQTKFMRFGSCNEEPASCIAATSSASAKAFRSGRGGQTLRRSYTDHVIVCSYHFRYDVVVNKSVLTDNIAIFVA